MKEHPRSSDLDNRRSKDSPAKKISKKASDSNCSGELTEAFDSPIGDVFPGIYEESIDFFSISAILDANYHGETAEVLISTGLLSHLYQIFGGLSF